jgi:MFS family permease
MPADATGASTSTTPPSWNLLLPLALGQFIASYAASNMNVAISDIAQDLGTTVSGVQAAITLFTLTMAALMIPGSKLTDIWGRKFCLILGLIVYGSGALIAALAPVLGVLLVGYSLLEGIGSALMIPPIYILITVYFTDLPSRARSFGVISGAGGIGAALGPLIGGLITTAISWRASFILQVLVVASIIWLARNLPAHGIQGAKPAFDTFGAALSAVGLFFVVFGVLQSGVYGWVTAKTAFTIGNTTIIQQGGISPVWLFIAIGGLILLWFFIHIRNRERAGKAPLISTRLFRNRVSNLGLVTQNVQWLILQGSFFVISVFLQTVRGYSAIQTGLILTAATVGILLSSAAAGRLARRRPQRTLIEVGFILTIAGMLLLLFMSSAEANVLNFLPGLFFMGLGVGLMLTSSVNVVQSAFPEKDQGEISGLSRSVSNLGSSLGVALVGSILVVSGVPGNGIYAVALIVTAIIACIGLVAAFFLPHEQVAQQQQPATA